MPLMNNLKYLILFFVFFACDSENAGDCFQTTGAIIQEVVNVENFNKILVNRDVELILKDGATQEVIVETGKNLINDVKVEVVDDQLILTDNNICNYVRDYGITKVFVTSPNITEIRSSTQYDIKSDGVLTYPSLTILSEDFNDPDTFIVGNFNLQVNNSSLRLVFNGLSNCFVSGSVDNLSVSFFAGNGRFEGENLIAENVTIFHRSSNDMIINPQQSIKGKVLSTGDVISKNTPAVIEVEELYKGKLIFQ